VQHLPSTTWTPDQLRQLSGNEELVLVLTRPDKPVLRVPVWPVTVGDQAYVRSYLGVTSGWYRAVMAECNQQIALGEDIPVCFESVDATDAINRDIDSEFVRKYATDDYRDAMITPLALDATLRILPR
jgi:hypothetical protein